MREVYRKRGSVVRYENGVVLHVREAGEAVEEGALFRCAPVRGAGRLGERSAADVLRIAAALRSAVREEAVERLVIADGEAEHEFSGRTWSERMRRVHLSVLSASFRVLIDDSDPDVAEIAAIAAAAQRAGPPRPAPKRMRLAPRVAAAVVPSLTGATLPDCSIEQVAGGLDGKGHDIVAAAGPSWPNWYRPSYRVRPQRLPLNVALRCGTTGVDRDLPRAIALLAPPETTTLHVLCEAGAEVFPTRLRIARIVGAAGERSWYPFGAGVWAGETEVVCA